MKKLSWLLLLGGLATSCQESPDEQFIREETNETIIINKSRESSTSRATENGINCGETIPFSVTANGQEVGTGSISINETDISISYDLTGNEWFLLSVGAFAGDCNAIPDPSEFPFGQSFAMDNEVRTYSLSMPLEGLPDCGCISRITTIARFNPNTSQIESIVLTDNVEYCTCAGPEEPQEPDDKNLRTQTPGGWGAPPRGNNPGAYLHANFAAAFPAGLVVGCDYTITLTSAQAVTNFLPQGGKPSALNRDYLDPSGKITVLASHVVALTLSVTFDLYDEDFGESSTNLANAVVTSGVFEGWTVAQVLAEAEKVLGGCPSSYSPSTLNDALSKINESFVDGTTNTGFLKNG